MKATGQLIFKREADGTISHKWTGGRRVAVTGELIETLTRQRPRVGQVFQADILLLRVVGQEFAVGGQGYRDVYVAMREGRLARFIWNYVRWFNQ